MISSPRYIIADLDQLGSQSNYKSPITPLQQNDMINPTKPECRPITHDKIYYANDSAISVCEIDSVCYLASGTSLYYELRTTKDDIVEDEYQDLDEYLLENNHSADPEIASALTSIFWDR